MQTTLNVNGRQQLFDGDGEQPLLWFLRDQLQLTGTKYGCGSGHCGACTVHVDGAAARSCQRPMSSLAAAKVVTIEGLATGDVLHPVQQAWLDEDVAQCGYCQAGQIMAVVALLRQRPKPSADDVASISNLCRCGTQVRIKRAIAEAVTLLAQRGQS